MLKFSMSLAVSSTFFAVCLVSPVFAGSITSVQNTTIPVLVNQNIIDALRPIQTVFLPQADASCTALLTDLSDHLNFSSNTVTVIHMTNYQANNQWWGGYTQINLYRNNNGHLVGSGDRLISSRGITLGAVNTFGYVQPFNVQQPDPMSYDIDPQARRITFQGQYGPYNMTCLDNKFAIVNTGDSIETFTFTKGTNPIIH